jgi:hypothetical protein
MATNQLTPVPPRLQAIYSKLDQFGSCISHFSQGNQDICQGACIDWIRRAVLANKLSYDYDSAPEKKDKRLAVMAKTHKVVTTGARNVRLQMDAAIETKSEYDSKIGWKRSKVGFLMFWVDDADKLEQEKKRAIAPADATAKAIENTGMIEHTWPGTVLHWNQVVKSTKNTSGVKAKNLSDLTVWGIPSVGFDDFDACLASIFKLPKFVPGSCIMIEAIFRVKGHAFAVHQVGPDTFVLFDPNFGIYTISSETKLNGCFQYLLKEVYPSLGMETVKLGVVVFDRK